MMDEVKRMLELDLQSVDAIAVTKDRVLLPVCGSGGDGKGALAMDRPIIPVPTVDSIAFNLYGKRD